MKSLGTVGIIGRFKPLHNGSLQMLESACRNAKKVIIGIGSSNKYSVRNPFTAEESKDMIQAALAKKYSNYRFLFIPDTAHVDSSGELWRKQVVKQFGKLDCFITGNAYLKNFLNKHYKILHPQDIIHAEDQTNPHATQIRIAMVEQREWKSHVPKEVVSFLERNGLVERFRKEFGKQTLAENLNLKKKKKIN